MPRKNNKRVADAAAIEEEMNKKMKPTKNEMTLAVVGEDMETNENKRGLLNLPDNILGMIVSIPYLDNWVRHNISLTCQRLRYITNRYKYFTEENQVTQALKLENDVSISNFLLNPFANLEFLDLKMFVFLYGREDISSAVVSVMASKEIEISGVDTRKKFFEKVCSESKPQSISAAKLMIKNDRVYNIEDGITKSIKNRQLALYELAHIRISYDNLRFWTGLASEAFERDLPIVFEDIIKRVPGILSKLHKTEVIMNQRAFSVVYRYLPPDSDLDLLKRWIKKAIQDDELGFVYDILSKQSAIPLFQHTFDYAIESCHVSLIEFLYTTSKNIFAWNNRVNCQVGSYINANIPIGQLKILMNDDTENIKNLLCYESFDINKVYLDVMDIIIERRNVDTFRDILDHPTVTDKKEGKLLALICKEKAQEMLEIILRQNWASKRADVSMAFFDLCKMGGIACMKTFNNYIKNDKGVNFWDSYGKDMGKNLVSAWIHTCMGVYATDEALYIAKNMGNLDNLTFNVDLLMVLNSSTIKELINDQCNIMCFDGILFLKAIDRTGEKRDVLSNLLRHDKCVFTDTEPHAFIKTIFERDDDDLFLLLLEGGIYTKLKHMIPLKVIFELCIRFYSVNILKEILERDKVEELLEPTGQKIDSLEQYINRKLISEIEDSEVSTTLLRKYGYNKPWIVDIFNSVINDSKHDDIILPYNILANIEDVTILGTGVYTLLVKIAKVTNIHDFDDELPGFIDVVDRTVGIVHAFRLAVVFKNISILKEIRKHYGKIPSWLDDELFFALRCSMIKGYFRVFEYLLNAYEPAVLSMNANYLLRHCRNGNILKILYGNDGVRRGILEVYDSEYIIGLDYAIEKKSGEILSLYGLK